MEQACVKTSLKPMRDSNIELYRIITMLLIVAHHYVVNSGLLASSGPIYENVFSPNSIFLLLFGAWGKTGINCFVLITGYFMCTSRITAKKFAKLFFEVMFYRLVITGIFWITGYQPFTITSFVKTIIPFQAVSHNFTGTFLLFFLSIPFLNILIHHLTEKQHIQLIALSALIYVFFGTVPGFSVTMNYVSWYMVLFFIASYIRLYPKQIFENKKLWGIATLGCMALGWASVLVCAFIKPNATYYFVTDSNTFLAVATGVSSFLFFKNIHIKPSKTINTISSTAFGVLLIHANSDIMRQWLWKDMLDNVGVCRSPWVYVHAVGSVIAIYAIGCGIDLLRMRFIEEPFFVWWDKHFEKWSVRLTTFEQKICQKYNIKTEK